MTASIVLAWWVLVPAVSTAQTFLEVSPLRVELETAPGGTHTQVVTLVNPGTESVRVRAQIFDWYLSKDGTPQFAPVGTITEAGESFSAAGWVRFAPPEQLVGPGQEATVRFTSSVPAGTPDGGYRFAMMFAFGPDTLDRPERGRAVVFRSRVATVAYLTVGSPPPLVDLTDLRLQTPDGETPQVIATLKNSGRVHVRTNGVLTIRDTAGTVVREVDVPNVPVLPASERDVTITIAGETQAPLPAGQYHVEVRIDVGLRALLVGETTVQLSTR